MSIHNHKCPECGCTTIALERRINGDAICSDCRHRDVASKFVDNQLFFNAGYNISGYELDVATPKDIATEACLGLVKQQDKFLKDFLAERGIGVEQIIKEGVVEISNGAKKLSYQGRDLIVFYEPKIVNDGMQIHFTQNYRILDEKP